MDSTLHALLADPTPVGRLVAADYCQEQGDEISEALLRIIAFSPPAGGSWNAPLEDCWHVVIYWGKMEAVFAYPFGEPQLSCAWSLWLSNPEGDERACAACCCWTRFRHNRFVAMDQPPPPGLETAVLAVLRRRLKHLTLFPNLENL